MCPKITPTASFFFAKFFHFSKKKIYYVSKIVLTTHSITQYIKYIINNGIPIISININNNDTITNIPIAVMIILNNFVNKSTLFAI